MIHEEKPDLNGICEIISTSASLATDDESALLITTLDADVKERSTSKGF